MSLFYVPQEKGGQLYTQVSDSFFNTFYDSQGYVGCVLTSLHMGKTVLFKKESKATAVTVRQGFHIF
jgi:hypothetical protein